MKATTHVETYSVEELAAKGYKQRADQSAWYLGDAKVPTHTIRCGLIPFLGRKLKLEGISKRGHLIVDEGGETHHVNPLIVKTKIARPKVVKRIFRDEVITFNGYNFDFPCSLNDASASEAREVAEWVLRVTK